MFNCIASAKTCKTSRKTHVNWYIPPPSMWWGQKRSCTSDHIRHHWGVLTKMWIWSHQLTSSAAVWCVSTNSESCAHKCSCSNNKVSWNVTAPSLPTSETGYLPFICLFICLHSLWCMCGHSKVSHCHRITTSSASWWRKSLDLSWFADCLLLCLRLGNLERAA